MTYQESQTYTATLNQNSPNGLYYWSAVMYYDAYEFEGYTKQVTEASYHMFEKGTFFSFKYSAPVIKFVRQDF